LLDTPLAKPERPIYISGPDDNVEMILSHLDRTVGPDNYEFLTGIGDSFDLFGSGEDLDSDEEFEDDEEVDEVETTGESVEE
jgi:hypothetical protein